MPSCAPSAKADGCTVDAQENAVLAQDLCQSVIALAQDRGLKDVTMMLHRLDGTGIDIDVQGRRHGVLLSERIVMSRRDKAIDRTAIAQIAGTIVTLLERTAGE